MMIIQIANFLLLGGWLLADILCLWWLAHSSMQGTERAIWVLVIVLFPFIGALAYVIVVRLGARRSARTPG